MRAYMLFNANNLLQNEKITGYWRQIVQVHVCQALGFVNVFTNRVNNMGGDGQHLSPSEPAAPKGLYWRFPITNIDVFVGFRLTRTCAPFVFAV